VRARLLNKKHKVTAENIIDTKFNDKTYVIIGAII